MIQLSVLDNFLSEGFRSLKSSHSLKDFARDQLSSASFFVTTDSRQVLKERLNENCWGMYIALAGENFDGFQFVEDVLSKGIRLIVFRRRMGRSLDDLTRKFPNAFFIEVDEPLLFLQKLSKFYKSFWDCDPTLKKVTIGVTGSNGKTTHKEMLKGILEKIFPGKVNATVGNLNNHIGVPLTLLSLKSEETISIVEMGMNHRHEILPLCEMANPGHGLITNIGQAHIGFLGSMDNIYLEKSELYRYILKKHKGFGQFVVNGDDDYLQKLPESTGLITFGERRGDIKIHFDQKKVKFNYHGNALVIDNPNLKEEYNLKNLVCVVLLLAKIFPEKLVEIVKFANEYQQPSMNRSEWRGNIFLDAYNANPSSMRASLNSFLQLLIREGIHINDALFILGDMNELGDFTEKFHREIARELKLLGVTQVVFVGKYKKYYLEEFPQAIFHADVVSEELKTFFAKEKNQYQKIFIKGSRSVKLESLL